MFTGIITDVGRVAAVADTDWGRRVRIATSYDPDSIAIGASIACSGPCLTVVETGRDGADGWFAVEMTRETLDRTTAGAWSIGTPLNLERSLRAGDELGGHMVSGHIDGVATVISRQDNGETALFALEAPGPLARFIAEKGSVALDGTSLTVNGVSGGRFSVMIIPHTLAVTTWKHRKAGDPVNLEVDMMARYVERLSERD